MPLNWRICSGCLPYVRRVANGGAIAADVRENATAVQIGCAAAVVAAKESKETFEPPSRQERREKKSEVNTHTPRLGATEIVLF